MKLGKNSEILITGENFAISLKIFQRIWWYFDSAKLIPLYVPCYMDLFALRYKDKTYISL